MQNRCSLITALLLSATSPSLFASGFQLQEASIAGLGSANALVAAPDDPGSMPYNPATMAFRTHAQLFTGVIKITPHLQVTPEGASRGYSGTGHSSTHVPNFGITVPVNARWSTGLYFGVPFGAETDWESGAFPAFAGALKAFTPTKTQLEVYNLNPNVSYRLSPVASIAGGIDYYDLRRAQLDSVGATVKGDGSAYGWNVGGIYLADRWNFGISYRSGVDVAIRGKIDAGAAGSSTATSRITLPDRWQLGARYHATTRLAVEFDLVRTGWSRFHGLVIHHSTLLTSPLVSASDFHDTNTYQLGLGYQWGDNTLLRMGYAYGDDAGGANKFNARAPAAARQSLSIGVAHDINNWRWEAGYMYTQQQDRSYHSNVAYVPGQDPDGTNAYNGTYRADAHLLGVGLAVKL